MGGARQVYNSSRGPALARLRLLRGQLPGAKGNTRARKHETVLLYLIGEKHTFRSPSDGDGLNGLSNR